MTLIKVLLPVSNSSFESYLSATFTPLPHRRLERYRARLVHKAFVCLRLDRRKPRYTWPLRKDDTHKSRNTRVTSRWSYGSIISSHPFHFFASCVLGSLQLPLWCIAESTRTATLVKTDKTHKTLDMVRRRTDDTLCGGCGASGSGLGRERGLADSRMRGAGRPISRMTPSPHNTPII